MLQNYVDWDESIYRAIQKLKDVNGRLELVEKINNNIKVYRLHTLDALLKTLECLRATYGDNITLVFGCGGKEIKRPLMAKIANQNCKKVFVTDDNPRNENQLKLEESF